VGIKNPDDPLTPTSNLIVGRSVFYTSSAGEHHQFPRSPSVTGGNHGGKLILLRTECSYNCTFSHCRLYMMTYFPSGFWSRLITRILADTTLYSTIQQLLAVSDEILGLCPELQQRARQPQWRCWQTGLELLHLGTPVFRLKEILQVLQAYT
jgi:hypothetical protein